MTRFTFENVRVKHGLEKEGSGGSEVSYNARVAFQMHSSIQMLTAQRRTVAMEMQREDGYKRKDKEPV